MRNAIAVASLLFAIPTLAADAKPGVRSSPPAVVYQVWGFQWDGRQYVKQATHSLSTTNIRQAAEYAAEINRYPGWLATTNIPEPWLAHAAARVGRSYSRIPGLAYSSIPGAVYSIGGWTIYLPNMSIQIDKDAMQNAPSDGGDVGGSFDSSPSYDNSSAIQDMINTQNMINNQQMLNNLQDMVNTQNMINTQNMVDAQNALNVQMNQ